VIGSNRQGEDKGEEKGKRIRYGKEGKMEEGNVERGRVFELNARGGK
jgi:hypothetical protein